MKDGNSIMERLYADARRNLLGHSPYVTPSSLSTTEESRMYDVGTRERLYLLSLGHRPEDIEQLAALMDRLRVQKPPMNRYGTRVIQCVWYRPQCRQPRRTLAPFGTQRMKRPSWSPGKQQWHDGIKVWDSAHGWYTDLPPVAAP